jgi:sugar/nucleoside kinase (ribokinase family)
MKLSEVRDAYETLSGKASEIARQLSLAGIAVIWIFKSGTDQAPSIDQHLLRAPVDDDH